MKNIFLALVFFLFQFLSAQPDSLFLKSKPEKYDGPEWTQKNKASMDLNQVSFTNWNSGGSNSISGLLGLESSANYKDKYFNWRNNASVRYGINKQESRETRKTDDLFELNSDIGYNPSNTSNWFYSAKFNFRTQLTNG